MKLILFVTILIILLPSFSKSETLLSLEDCISIALQNNLNIKIGNNRLLNAKSAINIKRAFYHPRISANSGYKQEEVLQSILEPTLPGATTDRSEYEISFDQRLPLGGELSSSYDYDKLSIDLSGGDVPDIHSGSFSLTYTQRLLKKGLPAPLFGEISLAKLDFSIEKKRLEIIKKELIYEVKSAYYELLRARRNMEMSESILELSRNILADTKERLRLGFIAELDKLQAEMELSKAEGELLKHQNLFMQKKRLLLDVLRLEEEDDIAIKDIKGNNSPSIITEEEILLAVQNSSEIKKLEEEIKRARLELRIAKNAKLPELDFIAKYIRKEEGEDFKDVQSFGNEDLFVGLQFSLPIGNVSAKEKYLQEIRRLENLTYTLELKKREIAIKIKKLIEEREVAKKRLEIARKNLENSNRYLEANRLAFKKGLIAIDKLIMAKQELLQAEINYTDELIAYYITQARLERIIDKTMYTSHS